VEFIVIESSNRKKPVAVIGRIGDEVEMLTNDSLVKRSLEYLMKDKFLEFEKTEENMIVVDRIGKDNNEYLRYVAYKLEPPLRLGQWGEATVKSLHYGVEKIWKQFVSEKVPE
jgi:hypothetical protein